MNPLLQWKSSRAINQNEQIQQTDNQSEHSCWLTELKSTINQLDITNIWRPLHPTTAEHIFLWSSHRTFTKTDHVLGHKTYLNKLKKTEIIHCMLSDHNGIKVEISNKKIVGRSPNIWKLNALALTVFILCSISLLYFSQQLLWTFK